MPLSTTYSSDVTQGGETPVHNDYDEMVSGGGKLRPHWVSLIGAFQSLSRDAVADRLDRVYRQYQDTALAYGFDGDRGTAEARRPFDVVPLVLPETEWQVLAAGLAQRARLLSLLVTDIYGPRRVLADRLVPPALLHANPRFLRACWWSETTPPPSPLPTYAADLVRDVAGVWHVAADRVHAPGGIGFALQNRAVLARALPEIFRSQAVRRIEPFFDYWRSALAALAPQGRQPARLVVMTPGPFNANYFEHAFLARRLDARLVVGADLTVRNGRVLLKTLGQLQPVDVILRFVDDDYCDPLELRGNSLLGVAGLLQAVRGGTVAVVNALGSSVVETPALRPYLPRLAESLLGESLAIPSLDTVWLGDPAALAGLPDRLGEVVVRPAFASAREERAFIDEMDAAGPKALLDAVQRQPGNFVAERRTTRSVVPVWTSAGLVPHPLRLRVFLVDTGHGYAAMPGGLAQVPHSGGGGVAPILPVMTSKDTWILSGDGANTVAEDWSQPVAPTGGAGAEELLSRNADDFFWLGRYAERLDNAARVLRSALARLCADQPSQSAHCELQFLTDILGQVGLLYPWIAETLPDSSALAQAIGEICAGDHGLHETFRAMQRIAPSLRDRLSTDMWRILGDLVDRSRDRLDASAQDVDRLIGALDHLVAAIAAFGGMASENMTHGGGWRFLDLGRRMERGIFAAGVLRALLGDAAGDPDGALALALELFDSTITYHTRHVAALPRLGPVFALLLHDTINPRSVGFQLVAIADHLRVLAETFAPPGLLAEATLVDGVRTLVDDVATLTADDLDGRTATVGALLDNIREQLMGLSEAITRIWFSQVHEPHSVGYEAAPL